MSQQKNSKNSKFLIKVIKFLKKIYKKIKINFERKFDHPVFGMPRIK